MPEDLERYWKVVRPRRHREIKGINPKAQTSPSTTLGGAIRILRDYSQGLLDAGGPIARGEIPSDFEEGISPWAGAIQSSGMREELEDLARHGYPIVEALQQESDVPRALNRLREALRMPLVAPMVPSPDQPMSNSSTLLREEAYVRVQGVNPDGTPSLYNDIERRVQEGIREMLGNGVRVDQGYVDYLRNSLLMEIEESTRSAPDPDPQRSWGPQEEALRMHTQVEENYLWYQSQGINMSRATLQGVYRDNGGLRMDFSQSRAEEERLQREAVLTREEQRRILETVANPPPSYEDMGRRSETLLRLATLFNELGVSCNTINHQGVQGQTVELQLNLSHGTPGYSIGCWVSSDGVVHLNLGYLYR